MTAIGDWVMVALKDDGTPVGIGDKPARVEVCEVTGIVEEERGLMVHLIGENESEGHCQICGCKLKSFNASQIHHILAWWRVPQFECDERNVLLLCTECHHKIHRDPFVQTRMIEQKCRELGIKVSDYYDNGEGGAPCQR